jgi:NDP-sugar pyrophosphorylase family protein
LGLLPSDPFLVVNGDTLCDIELAPMIAAHEASGALVTLAVAPNPAPDRYNGLAVDADNRLAGFVPRGQVSASWHFVGVQVVSATMFEALPDGVQAETIHGIYRAADGSARAGLHVHRVSSSFIDVGTPADYLAAAQSIGHGAAAPPGAAIAPGARIHNSIVWPGALVGEHATLEGCVVTNVNVPAGFKAENAVLVPASVCRSDDRATVTGGIACFPLS